MKEVRERASSYLRRAEEFARKAEAAADPDTQRNYRGLAESYARLSRKVFNLCGAAAPATIAQSAPHEADDKAGSQGSVHEEGRRI